VEVSVLVLVLTLALLSTSCVPRPWNLRAFPRCADGLPVEILIDPACPPDGVCGYSCLPGRWGQEVVRGSA
jgi:hypothetical protein